MLNQNKFIAEITVLAQWFGKEIPEPLMPRMYEALSMLTDEEFENGCRGVLATERFFPPLERFIEFSNPVALDNAKRQWHEIQAGSSSNLDDVTKGMPDYLRSSERHLKQEFIQSYMRSSITSGQDLMTPERVSVQLRQEMDRLQINSVLQSSWTDKPVDKAWISDLNQQERISYLGHLKSQKLLEAAS